MQRDPLGRLEPVVLGAILAVTAAGVFVHQLAHGARRLFGR